MTFDPATAALRLGTGAAACTLLTLLGCATRLWNLHHPQTPVYDETHVGRFLNWYHDRAFFFDVHGPLSKLLMYWTATMLGFEGRASCPYEDTQPFAADCSLAAQRLLPALCGACMIPLTFATCCAMRLHPLAAMLCSWLVLVDTLWLGLSRLHLNDMVQMVFIASTHLLAIYSCETPRVAAAGERSLLATTGLLAATGMCLGCALQCKYAMALTTLAWLGLQNLAFLAHHWVRWRDLSSLVGQAALRGLLLLGLPLLLHLSLFALHLAYLPNTGNGDGYMSEAFQSTLIGNKHHGPTAAAATAATATTAAHSSLPPSFLSLVWEHSQAQFFYNRNMAIMFPRGSHPFDSAWHSWPLARRGVYFNLVRDWHSLAATVSKPQTLGFFLHPNPYIALTTSALVALSLLYLAALVICLPWMLCTRGSAAVGRLARDCWPGEVGSLAVAYLLHWLPYATQERQTFLFYYLPAYYFAILLSGRAWHATACAWLRPHVAAAATIAVGAVFGHTSWLLAPLAFASPTHVDEWTAALRLASTEVRSGLR